MRTLACRSMTWLSLATIIALAPAFAGKAVAQENPAEVIAAHIRRQGFACDNALRAQRNRGASKPNEAAWTLRCSNATYQVRLVPDMAARVELVKNGSRPEQAR